MTGKKIIMILLITGTAIVLFFILALFLTLRTRKKSLTQDFPYAELIATEHTTKRVCYIAKNYEHFVNEHPYLLKSTKEFFSEAGETYEIPIGTALQLTGAKAFTGGTSGTTSNYVFGRIYIEALQQEVEFEYNCDAEKPLELSDYNNYRVYPITPWQENALPIKVSVTDATKSEYIWPLVTTNEAFNDVLSKIFNSNEYMGNRDFENTTFEKDRYKVGMKSYDEAYYQILPENYALLQLNKVYPEIMANNVAYIVGNDHRLNLSQNFISFVVTTRVEKGTMESTLINYNKQGEYIDHIVMSRNHRDTDLKLTANCDNLFNDKKLRITDENLEVTEYQLFENDTIERAENQPIK
jgi:hypothetical protein